MRQISYANFWVCFAIQVALAASMGDAARATAVASVMLILFFLMGKPVKHE